MKKGLGHLMAITTGTLLTAASCGATLHHEPGGGGFYTTNAIPHNIRIPLTGTGGNNRIWLVTAHIETGAKTGEPGTAWLSLGNNTAAPALLWHYGGGTLQQTHAGVFPQEHDTTPGQIRFSARIYPNATGRMKIERETTLNNAPALRETFILPLLETETPADWSHLDCIIAGDCAVKAISFRAVAQSLFIIR